MYILENKKNKEEEEEDIHIKISSVMCGVKGVYRFGFDRGTVWLTCSQCIE